MNITIDIGERLLGVLFVAAVLWFIFRSDK